MSGYLFDTNIWSYAFEEAEFVTKRIRNLEKSQIYLSSVVWGEMICGAKANPKFPFDTYKDFIHKDKPLILPIDQNVAEAYGALKALVFEKRSDRVLRSNTGRVSLFKTPIPSKDMGVHENDLWIASQSLAYNLILITNEQMNTLFELTRGELKYEIWQ
jgi:predicted nucleic acid-binding protein